MLRVAALTLLIASTSLAAGKKKKPPPPPPPPVPTAPTPQLAEAFGNKVVDLLESSSQVSAWRVGFVAGIRPAPEKAIGSDFERQAAGKVLEADEVKQLKGLLYTEGSFKLGSAPRCEFVPEVAFQAQAGTENLEVLLSFKCNALMFFTTKPGGRSTPGAMLDIRPGRKAFLTLAKQALPNNRATQALK